jgi:hypothetical protein
MVRIPASVPERMSVSMRSPTMYASAEWAPSLRRAVRIMSGFGLPMK